MLRLNTQDWNFVMNSWRCTTVYVAMFKTLPHHFLMRSYPKSHQILTNLMRFWTGSVFISILLRAHMMRTKTASASPILTASDGNFPTSKLILSTDMRLHSDRKLIMKSLRFLSTEELVEILKMRQVEKHEKYLGIPSLGGRSKKFIFDSLLDIIWKNER